MKTMIAEEKLRRIWEGCLKNERKQQELLYRMLSPKMMAVCIRYTNNDNDEAQDILHEGFIKILHNMHRYRGEGSLEGWMRRIMVQLAISRYSQLKPLILKDEISDNVINLHASCQRNSGLKTKDL